MNMPAIDPAAIDELNALEPGLAAQLVEIFLSDASATISTLSTAVANRDRPTINRLAHHLKSGSTAFGARRLMELCDDGDTADDLAIWFSHVEAECARVAAALAAL
jgi:HPt (histidine-containing phosphotransfer) domain-containing protein